MAAGAQDHTEALAGLRARVITAARQARPPGQSVPEIAGDSPAEAFARAAHALDLLLGSLDPGDWRQPVIRDLDVQGLVGHLIGVEEDLQRSLSGEAAPGTADHVRSTQPMAQRQAGRPPKQTRLEWRRATDRTLAQISDRGEIDAPVALHGVQLPLDDILIARAFELWTHENDIRSAVGRPLSAPAPAALRPMASLAVRLLPFAALMTDVRDPVRLHLVLTGPGGGTWDIGIGVSPPEPVSIGVVTDVVSFCRLVANRLQPDDLESYVSGDAVLARSVLAAATSLALD
ncbi:MAG TPA: maleylpyruvate isomerase family mycothiol-dependent enzyme [Streptosporangiaceae bacterium]|jgi:uncharacterized protein (TIGR03083 family)